jgi:hypothetical protein
MLIVGLRLLSPGENRGKPFAFFDFNIDFLFSFLYTFSLPNFSFEIKNPILGWNSAPASFFVFLGQESTQPASPPIIVVTFDDDGSIR